MASEAYTAANAKFVDEDYTAAVEVCSLALHSHC